MEYKGFGAVPHGHLVSYNGDVYITVADGGGIRYFIIKQNKEPIKTIAHMSEPNRHPITDKDYDSGVGSILAVDLRQVDLNEK